MVPRYFSKVVAAGTQIRGRLKEMSTLSLVRFRPFFPFFALFVPILVMLFLDELNSKFLLNLRCTVQSIHESGWELYVSSLGDPNKCRQKFFDASDVK